MAKVNNKPASAYAKPHTMSGGPVAFSSEPEYDRSHLTDKLNISVGNVCKGDYTPTEKEGLTTRGNGAATKGTKARGPMA